MMKHNDLSIVLGLHQKHPYQWGKWDCMTFVNDCIGAITNFDHMSAFDSYDTQSGALRALNKLGYKSAFGYFMDKFEAVPVASVGVGDLVFLEKGANKLTAPAVIFGDTALARVYDGWLYKRPSVFTLGFKVI